MLVIDSRQDKGGGRLTPGEAQRRQAREDRRAEAQRRARENTPVSKPNAENVPTAKKPDREKVDPRLERAANQVIDSLRKGNTLAITNRETGLSDSEKARVADLMKKVGKAKKNRKTQQTEKDILDYGREKEGIAERPIREENKHKDAKLLYQYKQLQDPKPKKPLDILKSKKGLA